MHIIPVDELTEITQQIFESAGVGYQEAKIVTEHLIDANLVGHDSHGVIRVPQYIARIDSGKIIPGAKVEIECDTFATAVINGNWGFGQVVAQKAVQTSIAKARHVGVGIVTVYHCYHVGRLGSYPALIAGHDMVGLATSNGHGGDHSMPPWGGVGRVLSPNSMAMAFPTTKGFPIVLDFATSVVAGGKLRIAAAKSSRIPNDWLIDENGTPVTDPSLFLSDPRVAMLPFGGTAGHKGSGLAIAIDILSGALSAAGCTRRDAARSGNALFVQAIHIEKFREIESFKREVDCFVDYIKSTRPAPGHDEILVPGERSYQTRNHRITNGIPIDKTTWDEITVIAQRYGIGP